MFLGLSRGRTGVESRAGTMETSVFLKDEWGEVDWMMVYIDQGCLVRRNGRGGAWVLSGGVDDEISKGRANPQCLLTLLDSPLNKAGLLQVYIHTAKGVLIEVNPSVRIPRTFKRFSGLMGESILLLSSRLRIMSTVFAVLVLLLLYCASASLELC